MYVEISCHFIIKIFAYNEYFGANYIYEAVNNLKRRK